MTQDEVIKLVQGNQLPQYDIRDAEADAGDVFIDLERRDGTPYTCVHCGQSCLFAYDAMPRRCVEDIPLGPYRLFWRFAPNRTCEVLGIDEIAICIASGLMPFVRLGKRLLRHAKSILE